MLNALAKPWIRIPHLIAFYAALAFGMPVAFFILYELIILLDYLRSIGGAVSPIVLTLFVVLVFFVVPYCYRRTVRHDSQSLLYSSDLASELGATLASAAGIGLLLRQHSNDVQARSLYKHLALAMRDMIENIDDIVLSEEEIRRFEQTIRILEDTAAATEYRARLTEFLEKYQEVHQSRA